MSTFMIDVDLSNSERILGKDIVKEAMVPAMKEALFAVQQEVGTAPPRIPDGYWADKTSARVKRAFFAKLRAEGKLGGPPRPYRRTNALQKSWKPSVEMSKSGVVGRLGSGVKYAEYIAGKKPVPFAKDRWRSVDINRWPKGGFIRREIPNIFYKHLQKLYGINM